MEKTPNPKHSLKFIFVAIVLMVLADHYLFGGTRGYIEEAKREAHQEIPAELPPPIRVQPEDGAEYFESDAEDYYSQHPREGGDPLPESDGSMDPGPQVSVTPDGETSSNVRDAENNGVPLPPVVTPKHQGKMRIAIIIDDLGMDLKRSRAIIDLPAPITLAFLPYGTKTRDYAAIGKERGHELIIHTPMEAMDAGQNIGPGGLKSGMHEAAFAQNFNAMLKSFDGYTGINNHMGSRLTQDRAAMDDLMVLLKERGLFFVDSKTISNSVAAKAARAAGVAFAERDVFLDHVDSRDFVDGALRQTEDVARRKGYAIAIGHPKTHTIEGLREWIPTLAAKGIELVPVSDLLLRPALQRHSLGEAAEPTNTNEGNPQSQPAEQAVVTGSPLCEFAEGECRGDDMEVVEEEPKPAAPATDAPLLLHLPPPSELPAIY